MRRIIKPFIMIILVTIIMMLSILSLGINVNRENMSLYAEGVENMNSGQTKLLDKVRDDLQYPNIYLNEAIDWENKFDITSVVGGNWWNLINETLYRYKYASIIVVGNALEYLRNNHYYLLPKYLNIPSIDLTKEGVLKINLFGGEIISPNNENNRYSFLLEFYFRDYKFYMEKQYHSIIDASFPDGEEWKSATPLNIYNNNSTYDNVLVDYNPVQSTKNELEIGIVIEELPLLNPIMSDKVLKFTIKTRPNVIESDAAPGLYISETYINFSYFYSGKDIPTGDEYRIIFNGMAKYEFNNNYDGTFTMSPLENKLWIQIYVKAPEDSFYTMTHREEIIGTANCYINSVRLITN